MNRPIPWVAFHPMAISPWGAPHWTEFPISTNLTYVHTKTGARCIRRNRNGGVEKNHFIHTKKVWRLVTQSQHWDRIIWSKKSITAGLVTQTVKSAFAQVPGVCTVLCGWGRQAAEVLVVGLSLFWTRRQGCKVKMEAQDVVPLRFNCLFTWKEFFPKGKSVLTVISQWLLFRWSIYSASRRCRALCCAGSKWDRHE